MIARAILISVWLFAMASAYAQQERILPKRNSSSLEGTSFVVGFMQNELRLSIDPTVQIFVACETYAQVNFEFPDGTKATRFITPKTVHVENVSSNFINISPEYINRKAIFVTSDVPIVVYTLNTIERSTDSYTAIPIKYLGTEYYTFCGANDRYDKFFGAQADTFYRAGEFMVMAVENGTSVTITPKAYTIVGRKADEPFTIMLSKGQTFLVQSGNSATGTNDLTGSHIVSTKPVAVLSGHVRTGLPVGDSTSKDHLVEMLCPVTDWGTEYVTAPFMQGLRAPSYRILASEPDTKVYAHTFDRTLEFDLQTPGVFAELSKIGEAIYWYSDKPFQIAQYMASGDVPLTEGPRIAYMDPALVMVPSLSQFVHSAFFQFPILKQQNLGADGLAKKYYFVTIVADSIALPTLKIGNVRVVDLRGEIIQQKVPGKSMYWVNVPLTEGAFKIECDTGTFSGIMYGTSIADSYANIFGARYGPVLPTDNTPPDYTMAIDCGVITGSVTDTGQDTAGVEDVKIYKTGTYNYEYTIGDPEDGVGTRKINAKVVDMWKDAQLVIHTYDLNGNGKEWLYKYTPPKIDITDEVLVDASAVPPCAMFKIVNKDNADLTLVSLSYMGDRKIQNSSGDVSNHILKPNDTVTVTICYVGPIPVSSAEGFIDLVFPCNLSKRVPVYINTEGKIVGSAYNFGAVKIGDTACARVPVINTGATMLLLDRVTLLSMLDDFIVDTTGLGLPRLLAPKDTAFVKVCFTPKLEKNYSSSDTIGTTFKSLRAVLRYTGKGISPRVLNVEIDWGKCRVGTVNNSIVKLINAGEARAVLTKYELYGDTTQFTVPDTLHAQFTLEQKSIRAFNVSFVPSKEGSFEHILTYVVDWRYHDTVRITLKGVGILPSITTIDIDMGQVLIGSQRDTTATVAHTKGSQDLQVTGVRKGGPDVGSFMTTTITAPVTVAMLDSITAAIEFLPQRVGLHTMTLEFIHDATSTASTASSIVNIIGVGIKNDVQQVVASITEGSTFASCVDTVVTVTVRNTGDAASTIDSVVSTSISRVDSIVGTVPVILQPGEVSTYEIHVRPDRNNSPTYNVDIYYNDSLQQRLSSVNNIVFAKPTILTSPVIAGRPGDSIKLETDIRLENVTEDTPVLLMGWYDVSLSRLGVKTQGVKASVTDRAGSREIDVMLTQDMDRVVWQLSEPVTAPFAIRWSMTGMLYWLNADSYYVRAILNETECTDSSSSSTHISQEICAGSLRMISFNSIGLEMGVIANPVVENLDVRLNSEFDGEGSFYLMNSNGEKHVLAEKIPLHKGSQVIKLCRSSWSSGVYMLILQHDNGEAGVPVIFVN